MNRWTTEQRVSDGWQPTGVIEGDYRHVHDYVMSTVGPEANNWRIRLSTEADAALPSGSPAGPSLCPRLILAQLQGCYCQDGKVAAGHFAIVSDKSVIDLGPSVSVYCVSYRAMAIDFTDEHKVLMSYEEHSPDFMRIARRALSKRDSRCMVGNTHLLYETAFQGFVTFYCGTKALRKFSEDELEPSVDMMVTIGSFLKKVGKFAYYMPAVVDDDEFSAPLMDNAEITNMRHAFENTRSDYWRQP